MSSENDSDEIPVNVISDNDEEIDDTLEESDSSSISTEELSKLLDLEKNKNI